jgi:mannose-P-dolichol utilization defect protein 1
MEACTKALFEHGTMDGSCPSLFLSKALSMVVLIGGMFFKVPQITKIYKNKSAAGVSLSQFCMEICVSAITLSFNYHISAPFSTYGESFFILSQNLILVMQLSYYGNVGSPKFLSGALMYIGLLSFLFSEYCRDMKVMAPMCSIDNGFSCQVAEARFQDCLQAISTAIVIVSRIPQIITIFKTREVQNLAIVTWLLNFAGASIRVFTTRRELPDQYILQFAFGMSAFLSGVVACQIVAFGGKGGAKKSKTQ